MRKRVTGMVAVAALAAFGWAPAWAQVESKREAGMPKVTTSQITGEVVYVEGNYLIAKMQPTGHYRGFNVRPGQEFPVDGQKMKIGDLKTGTVLTATAVTTERPMVARTHDVLNGTVWWATGNYVVLTDEKGENREYNVPESYKFTGGGQARLRPRPEEGHEGAGRQDRGRAIHRDLHQGGGDRQGPEV